MGTGATERPGESGPPAELAFTGARVIDPESGLDGVRTVGVRAGRIVAVSAGPVPARTTVDVSGLVLAPGFIDLHSHAQSVTGHRLQALDGVTTTLDLEAGALPLAETYDRAAQAGRPLNYGFSASWVLARMRLFDGVDPHGALSAFSANQDRPNWRRPVGERDVDRLLDLIGEQVADGAVGIGVLVGYAPDTGRMEYLRLARLAATLGVPTFTHARFKSTVEPGTAVEGMLEVISAAASTGAHMHICHLNSTSDRMIDDVAAAIEQARGHGVRVTTEAYPYGASSTVIGAPFFDPDYMRRVGSPADSLTYLPTGERVADFERLAELRRLDPGGLAIHDYLDESDDADRATLLRSLLLADTAIASDAMPMVDATTPDPGEAWPVSPDARVHPRSAGCFSRTFRWLVRELGVLSLNEAVRRCSLLPAQILADAAPAMADKGRVQVGKDADLVVFDPATVADQATYTRLAPSTGIRHVLVNGEFVVRDGELDPDARPGRPIRGRGR